MERILLVLVLLGYSTAFASHHGVEYAMCSTRSGILSHIRIETFGGPTYCQIDVGRILYQNRINTTGWAFVEIEMAEKLSPAIQGYAAGYLEGVATRDLIHDHVYNLFYDYCKGAEEYCKKLRNFVVDNFAFMRKKIEHHPASAYWRQVNLTLNHLHGLIDGYEGKLLSDRSDEDLAAHGILMLQLQAEIWDYEDKFERPKHLKTWRSHCSAIVKVTEGNEKLIFSHNTWDTTASMLRVQRRLRFKLNVPGMEYSMSSYPGTTTSVDDFYLTGARLAIMETTNEVYNKALYKYVTPKSVPTWIRSQVATRMASTATEWHEIFAKDNSGTYNNQWMVVDYKLFRPAMNELPDGLFVISEQMPGKITMADMTWMLRERSFFPSNNRAYLPLTRSYGGQDEVARKYGDLYLWDKCPRHKIFERDHDKVVDLVTLRQLMRYNDFKNDELSRCSNCSPAYNGMLAIASRADLNAENVIFPYPDMSMADLVATDYKATDEKLIRSLSFDAESGPTHDQQPVFDWNTSRLKDKVRHRGQPQQFNFETYRHVWKKRSLYRPNLPGQLCRYCPYKSPMLK